MRCLQEKSVDNHVEVDVWKVFGLLGLLVFYGASGDHIALSIALELEGGNTEFSELCIAAASVQETQLIYHRIDEGVSKLD